MKTFELPKLPEGCQYGEEMVLPLPSGGESFHAPSGCVIKSVDFDTRQAICVPIQQEVNGVVKTIAG